MGDAARLRAWCRGVGVRLEGGYEPQDILDSLHALRAAAHDIASAVHDAHRPQQESVDLVNLLAAAEPPARPHWSPRLTAGGRRREAGR